MWKKAVVIALSLIPGLLTAPVLAQSPGSPGTVPVPTGEPAPWSPGTSNDSGYVGVTTDRWSATRMMLGSDLLVTSLEDSGGEGATSVRLDLYGQYMAATNAGNFGFYGTVPLSYISIFGESESEVGNPEIGGLYAPQISGVELVLRAGITLPVLDETSGFVSVLSGFGRLTDFTTQAPTTTLLRVSGSPMLRSGALVGRVDVGLDVPLSSDDQVNIESSARINLAVGADLGQFVLAGELANLVVLGEETEAIHSLGLSAHMKLGDVQPFVGLVVPVDSDLSQIINFSMALGVRFAPAS